MRRFFGVLIVAVALTGCVGGSGSTKPVAVVGTQQQREMGQASWYGGQFHGRKTASGETFDENAMTAAHKRLPFGTRVRVVNTESGRSVVVRINDRMPDTASNRGRVIDLSKGAFARLAPLERGLVPVRLEPID
jgi:rare lipoprotein A